MPPQAVHIKQAHHNAEFLGTINKTQFKDWTVTVLFYTGLHYVDALLAGKNKHPSNHPERDAEIRALNELRPIFPSYSALKDASYNARYEPEVFYTTDFVRELETKHLETVRRVISGFVPI